MVGSRIATEAVGRGHEVTAASRSGRVPVPGVAAAVAADAGEATEVARLAMGADAVASALAPPRDGTDPAGPFLAVNRALIDGLRTAGVGRLVVVGGAGSLEVEPGLQLVDTPGFPAWARGEALAHRDVLALYRSVADLRWTYISPAAQLGPGERTGRYHVGGDRLPVDAEGVSRISAEDYAIAFVDELERGEHIRTRISVAY